MSKSTRSTGSSKIVGCAALIALALLLVGGFFFALQIPDVNEQMPLNVSPIIVTLMTPLNDATIPLSDPTTISVDAIGPQPIVAVELWVDGVRLFAKTSEAGLKQFTTTWSWVPQDEGTHTLIARAMDTQLLEGQSNIVQVVASKEANPTTQVAYKTQLGDTLPAIAEKFKVPPQQVIDANPQINPKNPIPPGQDVVVPLPDSSEPGPGADNSTPESSSGNPPPPPPDPGQGAPPGPPNKWLFWLKALSNQFNKSNPPAKPGLATVVEGCNIKLMIADNALNEDGFYINRAGQPPVLKPIATLGAHNGATPFIYTTDANLIPGQYVYDVVAFNPAGTALSNLVQVKITDGQCKKEGEVFEFKNPVLKIPPLTVDKAYCYLKINNGVWNRIPHAPNTFLLPNAQGTFDVSAYLKSLPIATIKSKLMLELDCWGWKGNTLIYLGNAKETLSGQVQMKASQFEFTSVIPEMVDLSKTGGIQGITPPSAQQFFDEGLPSILPPGKLRNTDNPKECSAHMPGVMAILGGEFACLEAIIAGNYWLLIWEWIGGCWPGQSTCIPKIDGYRLYRQDFPAPSLVKENKGEGLKVAIFPAPVQQWPPQANAPWWVKIKSEALSKNCYFVRAYKDGVGESPDSQTICLPLQNSSQSIQVKTLSPTALTTAEVWLQQCGSTSGLFPILPSGVPADQLLVGYHHSTAGCMFNDQVFRGAAFFDLSQFIGNQNVAAATLSFDLLDSQYHNESAPVNATKYQCAAYLMVGKESWMGKKFSGYDHWIKGENFWKLNPGPVFTNNPVHNEVDVTIPVREMVQGTKPNYGFVLRTANEKLLQQNNNVCLSWIGNLKLVVKYKPL